MEQAQCIVKMETAKAKKQGYATNGYEICKVLTNGEKDLGCGWYRNEMAIEYPNGKKMCFYGAMFRK